MLCRNLRSSSKSAGVNEGKPSSSSGNMDRENPDNVATTTVSNGANTRIKRRKIFTYHLVTPEEPERTIINTKMINTTTKDENDDDDDDEISNNDIKVLTGPEDTLDEKSFYRPSLEDTRKLETNILRTVIDLKNIKNNKETIGDMEIDNIIDLLNRSLSAVSHWTLQSHLAALKDETVPSDKTYDDKDDSSVLNNHSNQGNTFLRSPPKISSKLKSSSKGKNMKLKLFFDNSTVQLNKIVKNKKTPTKKHLLLSTDNLLIKNSHKSDITDTTDANDSTNFNKKMGNVTDHKSKQNSVNKTSNRTINSSPENSTKSDVVKKVNGVSIISNHVPTRNSDNNNISSGFLKLIESNKPHPRMRRISDNPAKNDYIRVFHLKKAKF